MRIAGILAAAALLAAPAFAHDGEDHGDQGEALRHLHEKPVGDAVSPFPADLGGAFRLTDQTGAERTEADPDGRMQLFFFGYANCQSICTTALPRMAEIADIAAKAGVAVRPVLITVDPERDTPESMTESLAKYGPDMIGLTGTDAELAVVRDLFQIEAKQVFVDPQYSPVYSHGSLIYLMDPGGDLQTVIMPIVSVERGAEIVAKYAAAADS